MNELGQKEKQRLRDLVNAACTDGVARCVDEIDVELCKVLDGRCSTIHEFIGPRRQEIEQIAAMIRDKAWELPRIAKRRIGGTFSYLVGLDKSTDSGVDFAQTTANVIDLMLEDCKMELETYREFTEFRHRVEKVDGRAAVTRLDWLRHKRQLTLESNRKRFLGMRRSRLFHRRSVA